MHQQCQITRENHLNHMVKVAPLIVFIYAIQCYFVQQSSLDLFKTNTLVVLGISLVLMIMGFITYDLTHSVIFEERTLFISVNWLGYEKRLLYDDLVDIRVTEVEQSFSNLILKTKSGKKYRFYFVDDADKIKTWLDQRRFSQEQLAA
jgi:hypothetical protein